ncbi:MAG TPA: hypothetical protein PLQ49_09165 [Methanothrix sp.]|nr:hypothetical protein [Methanothrix sp.]HRW83314.1 hypothetical protein [Methanothrix sp.]
MENKSILLVGVYFLIAGAYAGGVPPDIRLYIEGPTDEFQGQGCNDSVSYLVRVYNYGTDSVAGNLDVDLVGMNLHVASCTDWLGNMGTPNVEGIGSGSLPTDPDWAIRWHVGDLEYEEEYDLLVTFCILDENFYTIDGTAGYFYEGAWNSVRAIKREWAY